MTPRNYNLLVKNQSLLFIEDPHILGKQQEQNYRKCNKFQNKAKHKVDGLVRYYYTKRNYSDFI